MRGTRPDCGRFPCECVRDVDMEMKRGGYLPDVRHEDRALRDEVPAENTVL